MFSRALAKNPSVKWKKISRINQSRKQIRTVCSWLKYSLLEEFVQGNVKTGSGHVLLHTLHSSLSSSAVTRTSSLCGTGCDLAEYFLSYAAFGIVLHDNVKAVLASHVS